MLDLRQNEITNTTYAEHTDDPATWASPRPDFDVNGFNRKLERIFGCVGSVPRFRLRWAGEHDEYVIEELSELTGYIYVIDGKENFVSCKDLDFEFPEGAAIAPHFEERKIFIPRWVIEEYRGGMYHKLWTVELLKTTGIEYGRRDVTSYYRQPSQTDLDLLAGYCRVSATASADDIRNGIERAVELDRKRQADIQAEIRAEMDEDEMKAMRDGIPGASKKYGYNPNALKGFNIISHSKDLVRDHNKKL